MKKINLIILISIISMLSCKTAEFGYSKFEISGMIYDFSNRPVPFCNISLDNKYNSSTDINGRFIFSGISGDKYTIIAGKKGYEIYIDEIILNDNRQIIYIRIPSQKQLLYLADEALTANDLFSAEKFLDRAYQIDRNNIEMLLYSAAVKYRQNKFEKAIFFLKYAQKLGSKDVYINKFLNILKEL